MKNNFPKSKIRESLLGDIIRKLDAEREYLRHAPKIWQLENEMGKPKMDQKEQPNCPRIQLQKNPDELMAFKKDEEIRGRFNNAVPIVFYDMPEYLNNLEDTSTPVLVISESGHSTC
ncbi:hypothetical protein KR009_002079 [Drosophila setifemur]|nr:hypothetical protein KR009_002079 [Drosophila setifemur]